MLLKFDTAEVKISHCINPQPEEIIEVLKVQPV